LPTGSLPTDSIPTVSVPSIPSVSFPTTSLPAASNDPIPTASTESVPAAPTASISTASTINELDTAPIQSGGYKAKNQVLITNKHSGDKRDAENPLHHLSKIPKTNNKMTASSKNPFCTDLNSILASFAEPIELGARKTAIEYKKSLVADRTEKLTHSLDESLQMIAGNTCKFTGLTNTATCSKTIAPNENLCSRHHLAITKYVVTRPLPKKYQNIWKYSDAPKKRDTDRDTKVEDITRLEVQHMASLKDKDRKAYFQRFIPFRKDEKCPITLNTLIYNSIDNEVVSLYPCCHFYYRAALSEWQKMENSMCPVCKQSYSHVFSVNSGKPVSISRIRQVVISPDTDDEEIEIEI